MSTSPVADWYNERDQRQTYSPDTRTAKTVAAINRLVQTGEDARQTFIATAWECVAYYTGRQWIEYSRGLQALRDLPADPWEIQMVLNYIRPAVDTAVAKLTQHQPGWLVIPVTDDEEDTESARASEKLLEYLWQQLTMGSKTQELMKWALITGVGVLRVDFDSAATDTMGGPDADMEHKAPGLPFGADPSEPMPVNAEYETGEELFEGTPSTHHAQGFPSVEVVPPFSIVFDPGAARKDLSDCQWAAEVRWLHIDVIRDRWPGLAEFVQPDRAMGGDNIAATLLADIRTDGGSTKELTLDRARVVFYYERPGPRHPRGYYAVTSGSVLLEEYEGLPAGRLPFVVVRYNSIPGKLFGQGMVDVVRPVQDMLNGQISKRLEVVALNGAPKWAVMKGSIDEGSMTSAPGETVFYNPGTVPPQPIQSPQVSPQHAALEAEAIQHIREISGINEITQGIVPAAISGRAAQWMAELDATKLAPTTRELEEAFSVAGSMLLKLWRDFMPVETTIQVMGKSSKLEVLAFESEDICTTNVRVLPGSMAVRHPSVNRETVLMLANMGMYGDVANDPEARARVLQEMEFGKAGRLEGEADSEAKYQREENYQILTADIVASPDPMVPPPSPVSAQPWEDHLAHIRELKMLLTSDALREGEVERYQWAVRHLAEHEGYLSGVRQGYEWWKEYAPDIAAKMAPPTPPPQPQPTMPLPPQAPPPMQPETMVDPSTGMPMDPFGPTPMPMDPSMPAGEPLPLEFGMPSVRGPGVPAMDLNSGM